MQPNLAHASARTEAVWAGRGRGEGRGNGQLRDMGEGDIVIMVQPPLKKSEFELRNNARDRNF